MTKKILLAIGILIIGFLIYIYFAPADYSMSREITINASAEKIFPFINNSQKSNEWMPWKDSDPGVVLNYSGPQDGVGSICSWDSKGQMGTGKAEVIESIPNKFVKTQLDYTKPFEMHQFAEISLTPIEGGTNVKWSFNGKNNYIGRIFCFFMSMDKMVGKEFTKGLETLKKMVEST